MNEDRELVLLKGVDKTAEVNEIINCNEKEIKVKFNNGQIYPYSIDNVIFREELLVLDSDDFSDMDIYYRNQLLFNVEKVIIFEGYFKVVYQNGQKQVFEKSDIEIRDNGLGNLSKNVLKYFKEISKHVKNKDEDKELKDSFLQREYEKINYINKESILNYYINKIELENKDEKIENIIYPFRFNISQKEAVENVFKSNISIIQGPPGTGKTQTILNIIANLAIMRNKTVAVVSNNNEAVKNVKDKLEKNGYGFIVADLGRKEKIEKFFYNIPQPHIHKFNVCENEQVLLEKIEQLNERLNKLLQKNNKKAELEKEIEEYKLEQKYFDKYFREQNIDEIEKLPFYEKTDDKILEYILDCQILCEGKSILKWLRKIKILLKYKIKNLKQLDKGLMENILILQKEYYKIKIEKLEEEYSELENYLKVHNFEEHQKEHQEISKKVFEIELYKKYLGKSNDGFTLQNYKENIKDFLNAFPVILSTTYSLRNSIPNNFMFDYVIIDESSQVDLLAGSLALSCAKNVIIVGDMKQLPQIVDMNIKEKILNTEIDICYDYFQNSILSAILRVYDKKVPIKILREHYRCHPKIIEFCNKRYYKNELIAFRTDAHAKIKKPLILYYTIEGNHMRKITKGNKKGTYNERELEVIKEEVLYNTNIKKYNDDEIGITTPYRMQADNIQNSVAENIQSDTIHKFQGREKKLMILSTVLDNSYIGKRSINFVDDPCMVNVAVSRAIEQFVLVTDKKLFNEQGNEIKSLLKYIKYNELDSQIVNSEIVSVFDLLYEVDGFGYHKNNPEQLKKDKLKDNIALKNGISILRFETGGKHYDEDKIVSMIRKEIL